MPTSAAIIHPDMGIGGAEQLIVNLALGLKSKGISVKIYSPHFDRNHAFKETTDGTLTVEQHGNLFPRTIFGKCIAFCSYIRMFLCSIYVLFCTKADLIVLDQVPMSIPLLRMKRCPILFYCHYPDKLLCVNRKNCFKRLYRWFIDKIEEWTMSFAHRIVVNSKFTQNTFLHAFPSINKGKCCIRKHIPEVLYPTIDLAQFDKTTLTSVNQVKGLENLKGKYLLSLNRYEAKKHIELAIDAFELVLKEAKDGLSLVIAGGYDDRVNENAQVYNQLKKIVDDKKVADKVIFLKNISNEERNTLMKNAFSLLYTPQNEHFGIVPLEGMYNGALVLACNSGGPLESIENNVTGYTLPPDPAIWANKLVEALNNPEVGKMREAAKARVLSIFTNESFSSQLHKIIIGMCPQKKKIE